MNPPRHRGQSSDSSESRAKSIFAMYDRPSLDVDDSTGGQGAGKSSDQFSNTNGIHGYSHKSNQVYGGLERVEELSGSPIPADLDSMLEQSRLQLRKSRSRDSVGSQKSRRSARVMNGHLSTYVMALPVEDRPPLPSPSPRMGQISNPTGQDSNRMDEHIGPAKGDDLPLTSPTSSCFPSNSSPTYLPDTSSTPSHVQTIPQNPRVSAMLDAASISGRKMSGGEDVAQDMRSSFEKQAAESVSGLARGTGEEDDAYHVRSTYARLEIQGVYGDGWSEGVERTRERAIVTNKNRKSLVSETRGQILAPEEIEVLEKVDRYGFFDQTLKTRSEHRLALLSNSSFNKVPKLPTKPPKRPKTILNQNNGLIPSQDQNSSKIDTSLTLVPPSKLESLSHRAMGKSKSKEDLRISKWERMLRIAEKDSGGNVIRWTWNGEDGKGRKLGERVFKGVPDRWRSAAWWAMMEKRAGEGRGRQPDAQSLLRTYETAMDVPSTYDVQIDLDVPRTISGHVLFHTRYGYGQRSLFHVLHCFSMYCSTCGYCQGMGPIAATLLSYFDAARTYAALVRLHDVYQMHSVFEPGFPGLMEHFYVQERLIEYLMPEVYSAFERNMISSSSYATKWYITLFANTVPYQTQLRIWDVLLLEGPDVLVMVAIAIIWSLRASLAATNADFEVVLSNLSAFYIPEEEDSFMTWIRKMLSQSLVREKISAWRRGWSELVRSGKSHSALM